MGTITINRERCKGCGVCVYVCKRGLIDIGEDMNSQGYRSAVLIDDDGQCKACKLCAEVCPDACIEVYKEEKDEKS